MLKETTLLLTCEHASDFTPRKYTVHISKKLLRTHRGIDFGAEELSRRFSKLYREPASIAKVTRLLVDLNRSPKNRKHLFSEGIQKLSTDEKNQILSQYYFPFRDPVEKKVSELLLKNCPVVHLSVHSFTPFLYGKTRQTDIGILFDPKSKQETAFAKRWKAAIIKEKSPYRVRFNYPYKGSSDGFTTYLRNKFKSKNYIGIELEVNQKYPLNNRGAWQELQSLLLRSFPF